MDYRDYEDDDRDDPQPEDIVELNREDDDDDDEGDRRCPACGHGAHWDAPRCPHCGEWFTVEPTAARTGAPGWIWTALVALLVAIILVIWHGLGR